MIIIYNYGIWSYENVNLELNELKITNNNFKKIATLSNNLVCGKKQVKLCAYCNHFGLTLSVFMATNKQ